jgi:hypothetical protein
MCFGEKWAKSLISIGFESHPKFLWITLLIASFRTRQSLKNQGFGWNAHKKSNLLNLYKSTTYERYLFNSDLAPKRGWV